MINDLLTIKGHNMKKHIMINLEESDIIYLKAVAAARGMNVSQYVALLAKTAVVYHNINQKEDER